MTSGGRGQGSHTEGVRNYCPRTQNAGWGCSLSGTPQQTRDTRLEEEGHVCHLGKSAAYWHEGMDIGSTAAVVLVGQRQTERSNPATVLLRTGLQGFNHPWWSVVKSPPSKAGDEGSIPGPGANSPHATEQLNPYTTTTEAKHRNRNILHEATKT